MEYDEIIERIKDAYEYRALAFLRKCAGALTSAGYFPNEPLPMHGDDYEWSMGVWFDKDMTDYENSASVTLTLQEARSYGDDDHPYGITFGLMITEYGGRVLGQFQPFNYTPDCWVDARDDKAVSERWAQLRNCDISTLPELISTT